MSFSLELEGTRPEAPKKIITGSTDNFDLAENYNHIINFGLMIMTVPSIYLVPQSILMSGS